MTLWGGRFSEATDEQLRQLNDSLRFDIRLAMQDIRGSIAYANAIARAAVITSDERDQIVAGLEQVKAEFEAGTFVTGAGDEDIHTAVERRLTELVGTVGGKLHTGRSRNDQVATDFRLWVMDAIEEIQSLVVAAQHELVEKASLHVDDVMPGYTHLQPAQPISPAHWLMSYFWMLQRDRERLQQIRERTAISPLGAGALAGTPFAVDRTLLASDLGFHSAAQNSLDAVSDRDFVAEFLFAMALIGTHLSRLGEDIVLYSNPALGYITLHDRYSTGSSLMPQKRNADPMELARGKAGRLIGNLMTLLTVLKGLPSGYNKDLQEDKESVFDSFDTLSTLLPVIIGVIHTLQLNPDRMKQALVEEMLATDLADYLVERGMPFRDAHHVIGALVRYAGGKQVKLSSLHLQEFQQFSNVFEEDVYACFDFYQSIAKRAAVGGTAPSAVREQIQQARSLFTVE
jgi:argininosuccinate lyase